MKPITKLLLILIFVVATGITAKAQHPNFTIQWNSNCELQSTQAYYKLTYTIIYIPTQTQVITPVVVTQIPLSQYFYDVYIDNWDCNIDEAAKNYLVYAKVERVEPNNSISCIGEMRSSYKRCSELYDGLTFIVYMNYP